MARDPEIEELVHDLEPQDMIDHIAGQADAVQKEIRSDA